MAKKYIIELTEKQARLLSYVCDQFPRLIEGQSHAFQDLFEIAWEKRCLEATGERMDKEFEGGWDKMREDAENTCKEIKRRFWDLAPNANYGIHYDEVADIIWDIYATLRYYIWLNDPNPNKSKITVDASPHSQIGSEPLIKVIVKDDELE